ncbi:MAG TPA: hypothetical protein DCY42_08570 [Chloroflexi bacterium]|nr:hypothetical protein [Chloroflexota bacterium]
MEEQFAYNPRTAFDVREVVTRPRAGALVRDFTYASPFDRRRAAYLVRPEGSRSHPLAAVLYVHWYEPESPDSNRTQFLDEAVGLASRGVVSLLIETMWSDRDWFIKRTQSQDHRNTLEQVVELRQAMDLLLAEPGVDAARLAYVGHDFGAMYGVLMGAVDPRPRAYVLMAGTPRFPDWYLYYPALEGDARQAFIDSFEPYDPISLVDRLAPAALLFQFGEDDFHVPAEKGQAFFEAAKDPKQIRWYNAGHGLNQQANSDRLAWLARQLKL